MKKINFKSVLFLSIVFILSLFIFTGFNNIVFADDNITLQQAFSDNNFRKFIKDDILKDLNVQDTDLIDEYMNVISQVETLDIRGKNISNLKGIEYFTSLTTLNCSDNNISDLILTNQNLTYLYCYNNNIKTLDIKQLINLRRLNFDNNNISSVDLSNNKKLDILSAKNNSIQSINLKNNTLLGYIDLENNKLSSIILDNNKELMVLNLSNNAFGDINLKNNIKLVDLFINNNNLNKLDLSGNSKLNTLNCESNNLMSLNLNNIRLYTDSQSLDKISLKNQKCEFYATYDSSIKRYVIHLNGINVNNLKNITKASLYKNKVVLPAKTTFPCDLTYDYITGEQNGRVLSVNAKINKISVPSLSVSSNTYNSIYLKWTDIKAADGYQIYRATSSKGKYKKIAVVSTNSYVNKSLEFNKKYYYKVRYYVTDDAGKNVYSSFSSVKSAKTVPAKTTSFSASTYGSKGVTLKWNKVSGANGYKIYRATSQKGKYKLVKEIKKGSITSYTNKSLKSNKTYYYRIKAYRKTGRSKIYSGYSYVNIKTAPAPPKISVSGINYNTAKLTITPVANADGYMIYIGETNTNFKFLAEVSSDNTTYTQTNLKTGKKYYFKVKSYRYDNKTKVISSYGNIVYTSLLPKATSLTFMQTKNQVKLSWEKSEGATGYAVYRATSGSSNYKKIAVLNFDNLTYTDTPSSLGKVSYYYKVRPIAGSVYGNCSDAAIIKYKLSMTISSNKTVTNQTAYDTIVNKQRHISPSYTASGKRIPKVKFNQSSKSVKYLRKDAASALEKMFKDAKKQGYMLYAVSGYRSYSIQKSIFNSNVRRKGSVAAANKTSAKPGESEHQTGLAMDISRKGMGLSTKFAKTAEGVWVSKNAYKYGFIIRYPKGKENITGYSYEPWHLRYVGKDLAKELYKKNLTMEEYFAE